MIITHFPISTFFSVFFFPHAIWPTESNSDQGFEPVTLLEAQT